MDLTARLIDDTVRYIVTFLNFDDAMSFRATRMRFRKIITKDLIVSLYHAKQRECNAYIIEMKVAKKENTIVCLFLYDVHLLLLKLDSRKYPAPERDLYYTKIKSKVKVILETKKYNFENEDVSWNDISHEIMMKTRDQSRSLTLKNAGREFSRGFKVFCSEGSDLIK